MVDFTFQPQLTDFKLASLTAVSLQSIWSLSGALAEAYEDMGWYRPANPVDTDPYNILVVGDGYADSAADQATFDKHVEALLAPLHAGVNDAAFPDWARKIVEYSLGKRGRLIRDLCVYKWRSVSTRSGIEEERKDTRFGLSYSHHPWGNSDSILSGPDLYERTNDLRREVLAKTGIRIHRVLILANSNVRGGGHTGGTLVVPGGYTAGGRSFGLFQHEFGHALGLGDEYWTAGAPSTSPRDPADQADLRDYPYPNVSWQEYGLTAPGGTPKAKNWPAAADFATAAERAQDLIDRKGAIYNPDAYRPAANCIMRNADHGEFCPVCTAHIIDYFTLRSGTLDFRSPRILQAIGAMAPPVI